MNYFSEVFVLCEITELFSSFCLVHIDVNMLLEETQYRRVLLLVRAVEEVKKKLSSDEEDDT